jgi:hypothetical protein
VEDFSNFCSVEHNQTKSRGAVLEITLISAVSTPKKSALVDAGAAEPRLNLQRRKSSALSRRLRKKVVLTG